MRFRNLFAGMSLAEWSLEETLCVSCVPVPITLQAMRRGQGFLAAVGYLDHVASGPDLFETCIEAFELQQPFCFKRLRSAMLPEHDTLIRRLLCIPGVPKDCVSFQVMGLADRSSSPLSLW